MSKKKLPKNLAVIMVCSALIIGSIGSVAYAKYDVSKSKAQVREYTTKINALKSDISNMQDAEPIKKEDVYKNLTALSTSGKARIDIASSIRMTQKLLLRMQRILWLTVLTVSQV